MTKKQRNLIDRIYKETKSLQMTFQMIAQLSATKYETSVEIFNFMTEKYPSLKED